MMITSTKNEQVKFLKGLALRKNRDESNSFLVEGLRGVSEGIASGAKAKMLVYSESFRNSGAYREFVRKLEKAGFDPAGTQILDVNDFVFGFFSETETPQGVAAVFEIRKPETLRGDSIVVLENLQDPGNMGTVIRTADAAGFDGIICTKGCVDAYNQKVIRSTAGSIFHVPVLRSGLPVTEIAAVLKENGYTLYAAHPRGDVSCFDEPFAGKSAIVVGNEANGLSDAMVECCDKLLTIPMPGRAESLNASVAAALLIYEKARKR